MTLTRRNFIILAGAATVLPRTALATEGLTQLGGPAFGSYWRALVPQDAPLGEVQDRITGIIAGVDGAMSPYRPGSDLSLFNAHDGTGWQPASADTIAVTDAALATARQTGGAFDPTVGPIAARFGFGPITGARDGDYRLIETRTGALRKTTAGLSLDLCGIAKGHALDRIAGALDALGLPQYLVELGGEVFARGTHPSGRTWQVAIDTAGSDAAAQPLVLSLRDQAVATSGNTYQGYEIGGQRYGHVIDPARALPVSGAINTVSVLAPTAQQADALATALMAMDLPRAQGFANDQDLATLIRTHDEQILTTGVAGAALLSGAS